MRVSCGAASHSRGPGNLLVVNTHEQLYAVRSIDGSGNPIQLGGDLAVECKCVVSFASDVSHPVPRGVRAALMA